MKFFKSTSGFDGNFFILSIAEAMVKDKEEIIFVEMSEMDYLLICHIKEARIKHGLTQLQLAQRLRLADGFISKVETFTERAKYSIRHLPLLANALECDIKDVLPKQTPKYDQIRLTLKRTNRVNKDGSLSTKRVTEIVKVDPITKR